jgi:DNA-binding transcriptional LysR family regulator
MLTLRQIEVVRAIMVTGTVGGAARLLNVSAPGVSRTMKHTEGVLGLKLFIKKGGRYTPTREANDIFTQINGIYDKVEDLQFVVHRMKRGTNAELRIGSVPSISTVMVPRAVFDVRQSFPNIVIDIDVLKIEEAIDYLLLGKGEAVAMSYRLDHPMLNFAPLATGRLKCIVSRDHPFAARPSVPARDIASEPLIGIDPNDPYGRIMASLFARDGLGYDVAIRARFGSTVCALVSQGLGVAVIDEFTLAGGNWPGLAALEIEEPTRFETYVATRRDGSLSRYALSFIESLRHRMKLVAAASGKN